MLSVKHMSTPTKNPHAKILGQKGGRSRASKLSPTQRSEIARRAAKTLWGKSRRKATLVNAADIISWADCLDAQSRLPQLLRKLIHAAGVPIQRIGFPSGEAVQNSGWDGILSVEKGSAFIPEGISVWELSADKDPRGKADADYDKRSQDPRGVDPAQSTFVFVTPRRWANKTGWVTARQNKSRWRDVRVYDADDLEQWLEISPNAHLWFSILLGVHPEDSEDLSTFWDNWAATTAPVLSPAVVLAGRDETVGAIRAWLQAPSTPLYLQAESRDESLAVFAAAIQQFPSTERDTYLAKAVLARNRSAWNHLANSPGSLVLIPFFEPYDDGAITYAVRKGHGVFIPLGCADDAPNQSVKVPRLALDRASNALKELGIEEDRAQSLAELARRSFRSFWRKIAIHPNIQQPPWANSSEAPTIIAALLAGMWDETKEGDKQALAILGGTPYEQLSRALLRWAHQTDPPIRRIGDTWFVVSKEDSWRLLAPHLTRADFERLKQVVLDVLGTPHPRFELPPDQRWMAAAYGRSPRHSDVLCKGLADTLALIGSRGETTSIPGGLSARDYAELSVRNLLDRANQHWHIWASLERQLPLLAEAAPDAFLAAVDDALQGEHPLLLNLFTEEPNPVVGSSHHTGVLWALETLAWSPDHLGYVGGLLAKMSRLDPGGKLANRPGSSLFEIFIPLRPQTTASPEQQIRALDNIRKQEPEVAWRLFRRFIPGHNTVLFSTAKPAWREWGEPRKVTWGEYGRTVREVINWMLTDAGTQASRWKDLIKALPDLPNEQFGSIVQKLRTLPTQLEASDRPVVWNALRELISDHRSFAEADWAMRVDRIKVLDEIFGEFEPTEPVARYGWLFTVDPKLPEGRQHEDWTAHCKAVEAVRSQAINVIYDLGGLAGILDLAKQAEHPHTVGAALGNSKLAETEEDGLLRDHLAVAETFRAHFAQGFAVGRMISRGEEWAHQKLAGVGRTWSSAQQADFMTRMVPELRTWKLAESLGPATERQYWRLTPPFAIKDVDLEYAARKFLEHGRPYTCIELIVNATHRNIHVPDELTVTALERLLETPPGEDPVAGSFAYNVTRVLDALAKSKDIDEGRIAKLEWAFLPLLGRGHPRPAVLHRELARNPLFFSEIVSFVFRAEQEEPREASEQEQTRAKQGYELLQSWRRIPGLSDDGTVDASWLKSWVKQARETTAANGRKTIGEQSIGHVLSGSPNGDDGAWPHHAVRDVIDECRSPQLERGFELGVYNSRGVVSKSLTEGGAQERQLANQYEAFAKTTSVSWPRTAAVLRRIADRYRREASQEDHEAELRQDIGI